MALDSLSLSLFIYTFQNNILKTDVLCFKTFEKSISIQNRKFLASYEDNNDNGDGDVEMDVNETTNEQFSYFSPFVLCYYATKLVPPPSLPL